MIARTALFGIAIALAVAAPAAGSRAQDDPSSRARRLFEEGIALSDRGEYAQAIERFRRSIALVERPSTLFNLGVALRELRRDAEAIEAFERFLAIADESIDQSARAQARGWIDAMQHAMEARGGTLVLEYEPRDAIVRVDGMEVGGGSPLVLDLAPGAHRVELSSGGRAPQSLEFVLAPGERVARRVELSEHRAPDPGEPYRIAGWVAIGASGAAFGGAVAASVAREEQVARYNSAECDPSAWGTRLSACPALRAEIDVTTGLAATAWIGAAALAATGVALVLLAPSQHEHAGTALSCGPGFAEIGIACAAQF